MFRLFLIAALALLSAGPLAAQAPQAADADQLPPDALLRLGSPHWRVNGKPFCGEFSPDGKLFAVIDRDTVPRLWDAATGRELNVFDKGETTCLAFSPDGKYLALPGWDDKQKTRRVRLVDLTTRRVAHEIKIAVDPARLVHSLTFSPDSRTLVTGTDGHPETERRGTKTPERKCVVQCWDVATGKQLWQSALAPSDVIRLTFAPGGKSLAVGTYSHLVLVDPDTGKERFQRKWYYGPFNFDAEGSTLWYHRFDINVPEEYEQIDVKTGKALKVRQVPYSRLGAAGPGGRLLVVRNKGPRELWDVAAGKKLCTLAGLPVTEVYEELHSPKVQPLAVSPDGTTLAVAVGGKANEYDRGMKTVRLFDVATGLERAQPGHRDGVLRLSVSLDGKTLASAGSDATVCLWDLDAGKLARRLEHPDGPAAISLSMDGKLLAAAAGKRVVVWQTATGQAHRRWDCPEAAPASGKGLSHARFTPDGKTLVLGLGYTWVSAWDVEGGQRRTLFQGKYAGALSDMALSPDGRLAALVGADKLCLWDVTTGKRVVEFTPSTTPGARAVAFSPDRKTLALLGPSGQVQFRDLEGLKARKEAPSISTKDPVNALAFSPDGTLLATATGQPYMPGAQLPPSLVQLWDVATGKEVRRFAGHRDAVMAVAFTPDGSAVVSGSLDNTILVWSVRGTGKAEKQ
jgi:WD40 repeat protein